MTWTGQRLTKMTSRSATHPTKTGRAFSRTLNRPQRDTPSETRSENPRRNLGRCDLYQVCHVVVVAAVVVVVAAAAAAAATAAAAAVI